MKLFMPIYIVSILLLFIGCFDDSNEELVLEISSAEWYTTIDDGFGCVHLAIAGTTNGEKVSFTTIGDGDRSEFCLELDLENDFNQDIVIYFTHDPENIQRKYRTVVTAYSEFGPEIDIVGCTGSGVTKSIDLESEELAFIELNVK